MGGRSFDCAQEDRGLLSDGGFEILPPTEVDDVYEVKDHQPVRLIKIHPHGLHELLRIVPVILDIHAAEERIVRTEKHPRIQTRSFHTEMFP